MQNVTTSPSSEPGRATLAFQELSKKFLLKLNNKSIKKAKEVISKKACPTRLKEIKDISRNWIKMMVSAQKVDRRVMRRSRTVTFENLTRFVDPVKKQSLNIIKVNTEFRQKRSITDEDLEEDLRKSLDFARKESESDGNDVRISLNLSDQEFGEEPFDSDRRLRAEPSSPGDLESESRESVVNKTSIYKIGDHLSDGKRDEARAKGHPIKKLKSIEESKKKKRRSIFYQMSLISQAEMEESDTRYKDDEGSGEMGAESPPESTLRIIKKRVASAEREEAASENVFLQESPKAQEKGTLEEFQEYLGQIIRRGKRGKKDQLKRYLELQLEIKKKMEELVEEEEKEQNYPKLIIKKQPKKAKKKQKKMIEKLREFERQSEREDRDRRRREKERKRRESVDRLQKINRFLTKLNMEKRLRKFEKLRREKEFIEKMRRERIDEKVAQHRRQLREHKQRQIKTNLKRIEDRRRQREENLRASNNLTRELLLQKKLMEEEKRRADYEWGALKNESRLRRKDENSSRFFNASYAKMKESQARKMEDDRQSREQAAGLARLKSHSPRMKKGRAKKRRSRGARKSKDYQLPEVKTNIREHLRKAKARAAEPEPKGEDASRQVNERKSVEKRRAQEAARRERDHVEGAPEEVADEERQAETRVRNKGQVERGEMRESREKESRKENLVDLKSEIQEFNKTFKSSKTDQGKTSCSEKRSKGARN